MSIARKCITINMEIKLMTPKCEECAKKTVCN
jgi:hypothetical protein